MLGGRVDPMPPPEVVAEVLAQFPRLDVEEVAAAIMTAQVAAAPTKGPPMSFAGELARQRGARVLPTWDQLVSSSGW
jgi:hypothetical protein